MTLTLLFISLLFFAVLCLYTLIKLVKKKIFLFAFIPLTIFLVGSTTYTYSQLLGYPTTQQLPDDFFVVSFLIKEPKAIYLWVIKNRNDIPRSYELPYKKSTHQKLIKMKKRIKKKGAPGAQVIRGKRGVDSKTTLDFFLYNFIEQEFMRKDDERSNTFN